MRRAIFTFCAAVSLLLCVATGVVWARSYGVADRVVWQGPEGWWSVASARGQLVFGANRSNWSGLPAESYGLHLTRDEAGVADVAFVAPALNVDPGDTWVYWDRGGFAWYHWQSPGSSNLIAGGLAPVWSVTALAAVLPIAWATVRFRGRVRARRRKRSSLCPACGYDLRASPGRCPECGTVAPAAAPA